jgi:predicted MFS family arabinose efflux permease
LLLCAFASLRLCVNDVDEPSDNQTPIGYPQRLRRLSRPARLYLLHAAFLTSSLAIFGLFFKLAILALGYSIEFIGLLTPLSLGVAAVFSLPLWWLAARIGPWRSLLANAALQVISVFLIALWPTTVPLLIAVALTGVAAVLFQVSAPPFMMRHSDATTRDYLFSADRAINIGIAGIGSLAAGVLPALFGRVLGVGAESATAYRATFAVAGVGLICSLVPLLFIRDQPPTADHRPPTTDEEDDTVDPAHNTQYATRNTNPTTVDGRRTTDNLKPKIKNLKSKLPDFWQRIIERPGSLLQLLVSPFLISWGAALLILWLDLFFKERFAVDNALLGVIMAGLGITTGLAALAGPAISARIGKPRTVVLTQLLSLPFLILLGFVPVLGIAVGAALARGALFNMGVPLYDAFAMERTEEAARPTVIGLINGANTAGYLVAPAISAWVQARYGFAPLFVATAICYGLAALANYWFFVRGKGTS